MFSSSRRPLAGLDADRGVGFGVGGGGRRKHHIDVQGRFKQRERSSSFEKSEEVANRAAGGRVTWGNLKAQAGQAEVGAGEVIGEAERAELEWASTPSIRPRDARG